MGGFSRFSKKLGALAGSASKKSGEIMEAAKLNSEINKLQLDIEDLEFELGCAYYEDNKGNASGPYADYLDRIRVCEQEIARNEEKLIALKGMVHCEKCGAVVDGQDELCGKCGAQLPAAEPEAEKELCRNCMDPVKEGAIYCPACGFLLK